jgi:hypothetical protein
LEDSAVAANLADLAARGVASFGVARQVVGV